MNMRLESCATKFNILFSLLVSAIVSTFCVTSSAQPGKLDLTFNVPTAPTGEFKSVIAGYGVYAIDIDNNAGTILAGGVFVCSTSSTANNIIGLDPSTGLKKSGFSVGAGAPAGANGRVNSIHFISSTAIQTVSQIPSFVIGGNFASYNSNTNMPGLALITASDGTPNTTDFTFPPTPAAWGFYDIEATGAAIGNTVNVVHAFPNALDNSPFPGLQRIFAGGRFTTLFSQFRTNLIYKTLPGLGGQLDCPGTYNGDVLCIANGPDTGTNGANKPDLFVGGKFTTITNTAAPFNVNSRNHIVRYETNSGAGSFFADGYMLTSLPTSGDLNGTFVNTIAIQADGKILIAGDFTNAGPGIARLNADGSLDAAFNTNLGSGPNTIGSVNVIAVSPFNQRIVVAGNFTSFNGVAGTSRLLVLNTDGTVNTTFASNTGTGPNAQVRSVAIDGNADIYIGGDFTSYDGANVNYIAKVNGNVVLPITLSSFKGISKMEGNQLNWQTATEINNNYFALERSFNGAEFIEIARVNGSGTSTSVHKYEYLDRTPQKGINYYKLKQIDYDENSKSSEVISVNRDFESPYLEVYPNPTNSLLTVALSEDYTATLLNALGYSVFTFAHTKNEGEKIILDVSSYSKGIYILKVYSNQKIYIKKIVVD